MNAVSPEVSCSRFQSFKAALNDLVKPEFVLVFFFFTQLKNKNDLQKYFKSPELQFNISSYKKK